MRYDEEKVDEMILALLYLTSWKEDEDVRAWKGQNRDSMDRLFEAGLISDPKGKAKSVYLTDEGAQRSEELFLKFFGK
jgi:hypothetical protein